MNLELLQDGEVWFFQQYESMTEKLSQAVLGTLKVDIRYLLLDVPWYKQKWMSLIIFKQRMLECNYFILSPALHGLFMKR